MNIISGVGAGLGIVNPYSIVLPKPIYNFSSKFFFSPSPPPFFFHFAQDIIISPPTQYSILGVMGKKGGLRLDDFHDFLLIYIYIYTDSAAAPRFFLAISTFKKKNLFPHFFPSCVFLFFFFSYSPFTKPPPKRSSSLPPPFPPTLLPKKKLPIFIY